MSKYHSRAIERFQFEFIDPKTFGDVQISELRASSRTFALGGIAPRPSQQPSQAEELSWQVAELSDKIAGLTEAIKSLQRQIQVSMSNEREQPKARKISVAIAAKEIESLFRERGILYYSDVMEELNLDLETVLSACKALEDSGVIEPHDE